MGSKAVSCIRLHEKLTLIKKKGVSGYNKVTH